MFTDKQSLDQFSVSIFITMNSKLYHYFQRLFICQDIFNKIFLTKEALIEF